MSRRLRTGLYNQFAIPAPQRLMRTSESSSSLSTKFAVDLENMMPDKFVASALQKRFGSRKYGDALTGETITSLHDFVKPDGTVEILKGTASGKIYRQNADGTHTEVHAGLTTDVRLLSLPYNDNLILYNGEDNNLIYDGTTFKEMSEFVQENFSLEYVSANQFKVISSSDRSAKYAAGTPINIITRAEQLAIASVTRTGTTATVTTSSDHNLTTGALVRIKNAEQPEYNKNAEITVLSANTFTYEVSGSPASPATVKTAPIKFVKGESKPVTETEVLGIGSNNTYTTTANATGFKITVPARAFPAFAVTKVEYRAVGSSEWLRIKTYPAVASFSKIPSQKEVLEISFDKGQYELRFSNQSDRLVNSKKVVVEEVRQFVSLASTGRNKEDAVIGEVSSITRSGNTATVTTVLGHGLVTGDFATIFDVKEPDYARTAQVTVVSDTEFTYEVQGNPSTPATPSQSLPTTIVMEVFDNEADTTVVSSSFSNGELTVTLADAVMPAEEVEIFRVLYEDKPPAFSFITTHQDRLFALSGGQAKPREFKGSEGTNVYYSGRTGSLNSWFSFETQNPNFFNTSTKFPENEELVSIQSLEDALVIIGRNNTQLWLGSDPAPDGDLQFAKFFNIGALSRDMVLRTPVEIVMATKIGFRSISKVFRTDGLSVDFDIGSNIDPTLLDRVQKVLTDDTLFASMRSFFYKPDGLLGFKVGNDDLLVFNVTEASKGWTRFTGLPSDATAYLSSAENLLLFAKGDQTYVYANGVDGSAPSFDDDGASIKASWDTPWIEAQRRLSGKYFELVMENTASPQTVKLRLYRDNNDFEFKEVEFSGSFGATLWDEAIWDTSSWGVSELRPSKRFKWIANSFRLQLTTNNTSPLRINAIRVHGQ